MVCVRTELHPHLAPRLLLSCKLLLCLNPLGLLVGLAFLQAAQQQGRLGSEVVSVLQGGMVQE